MDSSQYKDYILTFLFVKYISDKSENNPDALIEIPLGASFSDIILLKGDKEIGDKINKITAKLVEANDDLIGVIDPGTVDFNDESLLGRGKEMVERLSKLIAIFEDLDFQTNKAGGDDLLGDAYEYLMRHFATESGKSKGQFYTPAEVSRILAKVVGIDAFVTQDMTVYDPTCGSGSLLLKASAEAPNGISIYGQENDNSTWALSKMNMIIHGNESAEIWQDNTLTSPFFKNPDGGLKTFDFAVSNPPFSHKSWTSGLDPENDEFKRFEYGVPPPKNGDYAFLLHVLKSLKSHGKGAVILPHGVLFRGNKEANIRKRLVDKGFIKGVIGLPANLFYGTGIPACIIVLDKESANKRENVFFLNARKGFVKDGNKNRLREQDVHKIVDYFKNEIETDGISRLVSVDEIQSESNGYNLNISRYINSSDLRDIHDLEAHLVGGIPNFDVDSLERFWNQFPSLRTQLLTSSSRAGYYEMAVQSDRIMEIINSNQEVSSFKETVMSRLNTWKSTHYLVLNNLNSDSNPRELIDTLSEDLLSVFDNFPLIDKYDIYQKIMEYWAETMQDDCYMIISNKWKVCKEFRVVEKGENSEFKLKTGKKWIKYIGQVIPAPLIIDRYFSNDQTDLYDAISNYEMANQAIEEFEEKTFDDGDLREITGKNGKISKGEVQKKVIKLKTTIMENFDDNSSEFKQAKAITKAGFENKEWFPGTKDENGDFAELDKLHEWLLLSQKANLAKKIRDEKEKTLMQKVANQYPKLSDDDCKSLVVNEKWYATLDFSINNEINQILLNLSSRIKMISERYASTLSDLENELKEYNQKVEQHLMKMGLKW